MLSEDTKQPGSVELHEDIVGRGQREGARLTRKWFASLDEAARSGKKAAYVFVMGSMS